MSSQNNMTMSAAAATIPKVECFICISEVPHNQMTKCLGCDFECCTNCFKYHIENSQKTEKNCMNCKIKMPRSTLVKFLGKSYIDKMYRSDIKELLFKEEMLLVPRSLPEVERRKNVRTIMAKMTTIKSDYAEMISSGGIADGTLEYFEQRGLMNGRIHFYNTQLDAFRGLNIQQRVIKQYKHPCENRECNGFVDSNWMCSICEKETCKHCHVIKEENHECKQEDIDTTELIKKNSKPCPKCNISIMKKDGCDQMWCVSCHTTFDWKTLHIKTGGILHNPEYFRYMRENGIAIPRNPNDNPCVDEFEEAYRTMSTINSRFVKEEKEMKEMLKYKNSTIDELVREYITYNVNTRKLKPSPSLTKNGEKYAERMHAKAEEYMQKFTILNALGDDYMKTLFTFYRDINHLDSVEIRGMRNKINNAETWKDERRVEFLDKVISESTYKSDLIKRHKELEYLEESMGYHSTIVEASKAFFIAKIKSLNGVITDAIANKKEMNITECDMLAKLKEFINDVDRSKTEMKRVYGYTRTDYLPRILMDK